MRNFKAAAQWLVVCGTLVAGFEGLACVAYPDRLARGLPTVCYGETEGVKLGDHYTQEECMTMLEAKLPEYWDRVAPCIHVQLTDNEKAAYTSFVYNLGQNAVCKTSLGDLLNRGKHKEACDAMLKFDMASGKHIPGLHRRRQAERDLCMKGL